MTHSVNYSKNTLLSHLQSLDEHRFVPRCTGSADFGHGDLTLDASTNSVDISSIVPSGTVAVLISGWWENTTIERRFDFYYDASNLASRLYVTVINRKNPFCCIVPLSDSTKLFYNGQSNFTDIDIYITGYWI